MTKLKTALLTTAALSLAAPASSQNAPPNQMSMVCGGMAGMPLAYCAYDQGGNLLGIPQSEGILNRQIGKNLYFAGYGENGFIADLTLFYMATDCSGNPLMQSGYVGPDNATPVADAAPVWTQWDGTNFWAPNGATAVKRPLASICYGVVCNGAPEGICRSYNATIAWGYPAFAPAAVVETPRLVEPRVSCGGATGTSCITIK